MTSLKDYRSQIEYEWNMIKNSNIVSKKYKEQVYKKLIEHKEWVKETNKKNRRKQTMLKNIKEKRMQYFATLTINPEWKGKKTNQELYDGMRKIFKRNEIDYVLLPEIMPESKLIHFHGMLAIENKDLIRHAEPKNGEIRKDKYGNEILELKIWSENYGFNTLIDITKKPYDEQEKIIKYVIKYSTKNTEFKLLSSRSNWNKENVIKKTIEMFGDIVEINQKKKN